ncbi:ArsR/SmtB family transcription factor [Paenarthrobacter sp. NCHU4564]|uniref:ArsR/SmtB family transcription factor n=1 Tax=Paenarthrobacter sp. NCHU4564 TaxID=3451353 RepID=UPI003F972775
MFAEHISTSTKSSKEEKTLTINTSLSPCRLANPVDTRLCHAMKNGLRATLLRMLSEAPGYSQDIAAGLEVPAETVEKQLAVLVKQGLVRQVPESGQVWYRLTNPEVAEAVQGFPADSQNRCPLQIPKL